MLLIQWQQTLYSQNASELQIDQRDGGDVGMKVEALEADLT